MRFRPYHAGVIAICAAIGLALCFGRAHSAEEVSPVAASRLRLEPTRFENMIELYEFNKERGRPTLITSDSVLHTAHVLFDYTLRAAELRNFDAAVRQLTEVMAPHMARLAEEEAQRQYIIAPPPYGYDRVAAYYYVAQRLLNPRAAAPACIRPLVEREVTLILAAKAQAISPILGVIEDYTQYKPRGHYTRNEQFERYFRAMMWYGRAGFPISGEKSPGVRLTREEARANAWAGMILSRELTAVVVAHVTTTEGGRPVTALELWRSIYEPTEFIVGAADDLTPPEYNALRAQIFGETLPGGWTEEARAQTDRFIAAAMALRPPKIVGTVQDDTESVPPTALRLMGQRFVPDSEIFQRLVHPKVEKRVMPSGLDVMAVLGSVGAEEMLRERGEFRCPGYGTQLDALKAEFAALDDMAWQRNAYYLWLRTLRALVSDPAWSGHFPEGYVGRARPAWWNDPLWKAKQLNAGLGSWAELRHDTILYAKQSYTMRVTSMMPEVPREPAVYVEPVPEVYGGIIRLLSALRENLAAQGVFPVELESNYRQFTELLRALLLISAQETLTPQERVRADFEVPTREDIRRARDVGAILKAVETLPEPLRAQLTGAEDAKSALIADVHTDPNTQQVLQVGVGQVMAVVVPIPDGARTVEAYGPVFTYYEFPHPTDARLTDGEWQTTLARGRAPRPFVLGRFMP